MKKTKIKETDLNQVIPKIKKTEIVQAELKKISEMNDDLLTAENVVSVAKNEKNPLHPYFEWDNKKASQRWRLWQARFLIKTAVVYDNQKPIPVYVSLKQDRSDHENGGGYRELSHVISDKDLCKMLLKDALEDSERFIERYNRLRELGGIFREMKEAHKKYGMKKVEPKGKGIKIKRKN